MLQLCGRGPATGCWWGWEGGGAIGRTRVADVWPIVDVEGEGRLGEAGETAATEGGEEEEALVVDPLKPVGGYVVREP